jgi:hypothetical protein
MDILSAANNCLRVYFVFIVNTRLTATLYLFTFDLSQTVPIAGGSRVI